MAYIYKHTRNDTNEVFYVGIGSGKTYKRAYKKTGRNKFWQNIVNKTSYTVTIIEDKLSWEEACTKEIELIKMFGRRDLNKGSLVNLTDGGEGSKGVIMPDSLKEFHRQTLNKHRSKTNEINRKLKLGTKLSQETINKLKGRKHTEATKKLISLKANKAVSLYSLSGELLMEFESMSKAAQYFNIRVSTIGNNVKGLSIKTKQGIWKLNYQQQKKC
jgi:hypothetical protein